MNGTPSISERYAILGDERRVEGVHRGASDVALLLLPRGPALFRPALIASAWAQGFAEVVVVEPEPLKYDPGTLIKALPGLRLIIDAQVRTPGEWINTAAKEIRSDRFLILWDDQRLSEESSASRLPRLANGELMAAPLLKDFDGSLIPSVQTLSRNGRQLKVLALSTDEEKVDTLFPTDFTGLYHRQRFLATGGFDGRLKSPFWQNLDWGFRSHLWGESLQLHRSYSVSYRFSAPSIDQTPDFGASLAYLRNLAVRHDQDHGELPWSRFLDFWLRSGRPLVPCLRWFFVERSWVKRHRYRFKTDARLLTELWGVR